MNHPAKHQILRAVRDFVLCHANNRKAVNLAMKSGKRDTFELPSKLQSQQPSRSYYHGSNGCFPQSGSTGRQAQPLVGDTKRAGRWADSQWKKDLEVSGSRGLRCNGWRRTLLLQRFNKRRRQEEDKEAQHQRFAPVHPDC